MNARTDMWTQLIDAESIVHRIERNHEVAAELFQELCLTCSKHPWVDWSVPQVGRIVKILKGLVVNRIRRNAIREHESIDFVAPEKLIAHEDDALLSAELKELLFRGLSTISPAYRHAIEQKYLAGKTTEAIAHEFNVAEATVRQWISRGLQKLRELLNDQ